MTSVPSLVALVLLVLGAVLADNSDFSFDQPLSDGGRSFKMKKIKSSHKSKLHAIGNCPTSPESLPIINGILTCSSKSECKAKCIEGYRFPNGELELAITCHNRAWKIHGRNYDSAAPHCEPICLPECHNSGICVAPNQCDCPENFSGPQCQFENKPCLNRPPMSKNAQRKCNSKTCTITCLSNFVFPDGSSVANLICKHGNWEPTRSDWVAVPDCQPVCNPPCENEGVCLSLNVCQCPRGFRGDQCQYREDACSSDKLGFNGAYVCSNPDGMSFACSLSCPAGIEFEFAPAPKYVCSYATGRYEPQPIPQCVPPAGVRLVSQGSYQSTSYVHHARNESWASIDESTTGHGKKMANASGSSYQREFNYGSLSGRNGSLSSDGRGIIGYSQKHGTGWDGIANNNNNNVTIINEIEGATAGMRIKPTPGTCFTWAGTHYKTFDGQVYSFESRCAYTLLKDTRDGLFTVAVQNEPSCNSYNCHRLVRIFVQGKEYTLTRGKSGLPEFRAGGKPLAVPSQLTNLRVEAASGNRLVVSLDPVGLLVKWDGAGLVQLEASESLWNRTDGLCGSMNGDRSDDLAGIRSSPAHATTAWRLEDIGESCEEYIQRDGSCREEEHEREAREFCAQLLSDGRYRGCAEFVDFAGIEAACRWGYCASLNATGTTATKGRYACDTMSVYLRQCEHKGLVRATGWRNESFCPMECTGGKVYSACGPRSQPICGADLSSSVEEATALPVKGVTRMQPGDECEEGCFCPTGTVMHGGNCIPLEECPCPLRGKSFAPGSSVPKDCNSCTCLEGRWHCTESKCSARCSAVGDPHYTTFDGKRYDFMGQCSYYLVKADNYSVEAENAACPSVISEMMGFARAYQEGEPSCTRAVTIRLNGVAIKLKQNRQILVNGEDVGKLPIMAGGAKIRIVSSIFVSVELPNGIEVTWDGVSRAYVNAPAHFRGKTRGLCGTFTANQKDDFLTPDGDVEQSAVAFANKWKTNEQCANVEKDSEHPCDRNPQKRAAAEKYCAVLKRKLFSPCHWHVDPDPFYRDCLYDMCACEAKVEVCLCPTLSAYAKDCAQLGAILQWRHEVPECQIHCPGDQEYQMCGSSCTRSCADISFNGPCKEECVEGCNCPIGYTLDVNGECIPIGQCPCSYAGLEFLAGYKEVRPGIKTQETCTCAAGLWNCLPATVEEIRDYPPVEQFKSLCSPFEHYEVTTCEPAEPQTCRNMHQPVSHSPAICRPGCVCKAGYVLDLPSKKCVRKEDCPCYHGGQSYNEGSVMQEECNTCTCHAGKWNCTDILCPGVCSVWGDSHYKSFDDRVFDFQGMCDYVLAKGSLSDSETFEVTIRNVACGTTGVACVKSVTLTVGKAHQRESLTLTRGKSLTDDTFKGLERIAVRRAGLFIFADVPDLGLVLQWDEGTRVYLRLDAKYKSRTRGLCGDFDDDASNDFKTPSGGQEVSVRLFADSWKLSELCAEPQEHQPDTCARHPERKLWSTQRCRIMKSALFEPCHSEVAPDEYIDRCTQDVCGCDSGGDCECLCTAIAAYAHECNARGVPIKWRSQSLCPLQCDESCSKYSPCVSTCPPETCDNLATRSDGLHMCDRDTCVEGCAFKACPEGEVYSNETRAECVPRAICQTLCRVIDGNKFYEGDFVRGDECHQCHCSRGKVVCTGSPCGPITTETPTQLEQTIKCRSGWTRWFNRDRPKNEPGVRGDVEELPTSIEMLGEGDDRPACQRSRMADIQCRTADTKLSYKEVGLNVDCSLEKGFVCQASKEENANCPDFEIRVLCSCEDVPSTTPRYVDECSLEERYRSAPDGCTDFLQCAQSPAGNSWVRKTCGPGTMFNPNTQICDFPFNVVVVRPECGEHVNVTKDNCTDGERWDNCAIRCSKTCDYYKYQLTIKGICNRMIDCAPGCVPRDRVDGGCSGGNSYWRDEHTCVDRSDCTCKSPDGQSLVPGKIFKKSKFVACQCINNYLTCTDSSETLTHVNITTSTTNATESKDVGINIVPTTASPPRPVCDEGRYTWLIEKIPDQVTYMASSYEFPSDAPSSARLHRVNGMLTWRPAPGDKNPWLEVRLEQPEVIYGVIVGGDVIEERFVTGYQVLYSNDGHSYSYVLGDEDGSPQVYRGPVDAGTIVRQIFKLPIEAKIVRISPINWHNGIAMQVELVGCMDVDTTTTTTTTRPFTTTSMYTVTPVTPVCDDRMGYDDRKLPEQQVTVSSSGLNNVVASNVRLSSIEIWRPSLDNPDQYVQFDFLEPRNLTGVETKGGNGLWTTAYKIYYGSNGRTWNPVIDEDTHAVKEFLGNVDDYSSKTNYFQRPIKARFLRIYPTKWHQHIALKAEIRGCYEPYPEVEPTPATPPSTSTPHPLSCNVCKGVFLKDEDISSCKCEPPLWWDGRFCVTKQECPCLVGHVTYPVGSSYETPDCQHCLCALGGLSVCQPKVCKSCTNPSERSVLTELCTCLCKPCPAGQKLCPTSGDCVDESRWCNGVQDCPDDERGCPQVETTHVQTNKTYVTTETTIEIQCVTSCPPGYEMEFDNVKESYGSGYRKKYVKKTESIDESYTKTVYKVKVPASAVQLQSRFGGDEDDAKAYCPKFSCRPVKTNDTKVKSCSEVACPEGYEPKYDRSKSFSKNKICDDTCVPIPRKKKVCKIIGNTFTTFDDLQYKYETCNHILARDRDANEWYIIVEKVCESRESLACSRAIEVTFGEHRVLLHPDMHATIDGNRYSQSEVKRLGDKHPAMELSRVGNALRLESRRYPFWVLLGSDGIVKIGVSEERYGHVDGMCGFFDGVSTNDQTTPEGKPAKSSQAFGDSWKAQDSNECKLQECPRETRNEAWKTCTLLRDDTFKSCSKAVDRETFVTSCMQNTCACLSSNATSHECRCQALSSFVTNCLAATDRSVDLSTWRSVYDCPSVCQPPFVHKDCFRNKCEMSCDNLQEPNPCPAMDGLCVPGCFCPDGLVRYGETCLRPSECRDCMCSGLGNSKYITFDETNLPFDGNCTYLLSRDRVLTGDNDGHAYQVLVTNGACNWSSNQSSQLDLGTCTEAITVLYQSHVVQMRRDIETNQVMSFVDEVQVNPRSYSSSWLSLQETPDHATRLLIPGAQLELISYKQNFAFTLRVPSHTFGGKMEGLCGDCNGQQEDDFRKRDGNVTDDPQEFGGSWLMTHPELSPLPASLRLVGGDGQCSSTPVKSCVDQPSVNNYCERLLLGEPFVRCHGVVDPTPYYLACKDSLCAGGNGSMGCLDFEAYARVCSSEGICVDWRTPELCPYQCPRHMEYRACESGCAPTCEALANKEKCIAVNYGEGCYCKPGQVWRNNNCVPERECYVCDNEGHMEGDVWRPNKCTECSCHRPNIVKCHEISCSAKETVCDQSSRAVVIPGTKDDCCPKYTCVSIPVGPGEPCIETIQPVCGYAQVLKITTDSNGCQKFICECIPAEDCVQNIDARLSVDKLLEPGFVKVTDTSGCCPRTTTVCKPELCPKPSECQEHYVPVVKKTTDSCCAKIECEPPADMCIYHPNMTNDFNFQPDSVAKKIGESWTDGKCVTCTCELQNGSPAPKCHKIKCLENHEHPDANDFVLKEVPQDDQCCPNFERIACKQGQLVFKKGDHWHPDPKDVCTTATCMDFDGTLMKSMLVQNCTTNCDLGYEYQLTLDKPNSCCGECVPVACVVNGQLKSVGQTWQSEDYCVNSTCILTNGMLNVHSTEETCERIGKTEDYKIEERKIPGKCCPVIVKTACHVNGKYYEPGDKWTSELDSCVTESCVQTPDGDLVKQKETQTCNTDCPRGWEYQQPMQGNCCGECKQVFCILDESLYEPGKVWYSPDNCTTYSCVQQDDQLLISTSSKMCPELNCPLEFVYDDGCCKMCNPLVNNQIVKGDCAAVVADFENTVGIIVEKSIFHGVCKNLKPVEGLSECRGHCNSSTHFDTTQWNQVIDCKCCHPENYTKIFVELTCENGKTYEKSLTVPTTCSCEKCSSDEDKSLLRPIKKSITDLFHKYQDTSENENEKKST